eukprot:scaffold315_cov100-Skeletonema_dohrnii-CCMP3373.AAC.8
MQLRVPPKNFEGVALDRSGYVVSELGRLGAMFIAFSFLLSPKQKVVPATKAPPPKSKINHHITAMKKCC